MSKTNWKSKFWLTYGELCSDVGDPIKVAKKLWNPLIFFCLMNVTKECSKMKEEAFSIKDITKFSGDGVLVSCVNCPVQKSIVWYSHLVEGKTIVPTCRSSTKL